VKKQEKPLSADFAEVSLSISGRSVQDQRPRA